MKFEELKEKSNTKILLHGKSGRGKTKTSVEVALQISKEGGKVKYVDTESEGSNTMVRMIERGKYEKPDVKNIDYERVDNYDRLLEVIDSSEYDLIIVDTLDHKHTYSLKNVTDKKIKDGADWNEYAAIYDNEKQVMEEIGQPSTNILCTIDPDSGKSTKPKGVQTNVIGYFDIVLHMTKEGDGWSYKALNFVGRSDLIGKKPDVPAEKVCVEEIQDRI